MTLSKHRRLSWLENHAEAIPDPFDHLIWAVAAGMWARLYFAWLCDGVDTDPLIPRPALRKGQTLRQWEAANIGMTENDWNFFREQIPPGGDFDLLLNEIELSLKDDYSQVDTMLFEARLRDGWGRQ